MYDGSHLYDFRRALAAAKGATPMKMDKNADDAAYFRSLRKNSKDSPLLYPIPDGDAFHRHAHRYGTELVNETAKLLGVDTNVKRKPAAVQRHRRTTAELTAQVIELRSRGVVESAIGDTLNIGDERVRSILRTALPPKEKRDNGNTYWHTELRKIRGNATEHSCADCGEQAHEWSYKEHTGYSENPDDYAPRCHKCHNSHDNALRSAA